jgi:hypothetical protein
MVIGWLRSVPWRESWVILLDSVCWLEDVCLIDHACYWTDYAVSLLLD